jgi:hypothetical protein
MTGKVKVTADQNGNIIGISQNNPEYGYIRVEQDANQINAKGWLRVTKRFAFIKGTVKDLQAANFSKDTSLPGKIVVKESFYPFNLENPDKNLKIAGDTGVICRVNDQPIYRDTFYTTDVNAGDELIMHTNTDEIREVQEANKNLVTLQNEEIAMAAML